MHEAWWVICLCAGWCGVCRDWRAQFESAARAHPDVRFAWVDVEDEADAMGDVDIETFPTVLVARGDEARFLGPIAPSAAQLARLLGSLQTEAHAGGTLSPAAQALLQRLRVQAVPAANL
ncbi:thioredoxin family protein [Ramlibacter sp.]|uniref:thioredoxin family protein n=1 Tax=Ramlibacter sp. TaxID=1917967 RepID=UPI003D0E322A